MKDYVRLTLEDIRVQRGALEGERVRLKREIELLHQTEELLVQLHGEIESSEKINRGTGLLPGVTTKEAARAVAESQGAGSPSPSPQRSKPCRRRGSRGGEFAGVKKVQRRSGPARYEASCYDPGTKKNRHIGTFDDELEAARAVAEARGDTDEIQRLSDLAEQQEQNPNRPGAAKPLSGRPGLKHNYPKKRNKVGPANEQGRIAPIDPAGGTGPAPVHVDLTWECNRCGRPVVSAERPKLCANCLKDWGFTAIKPRPKPDEF